MMISLTNSFQPAQPIKLRKVVIRALQDQQVNHLKKEQCPEGNKLKKSIT